MRNICLILFFILSASVYSQTETSKDSIAKPTGLPDNISGSAKIGEYSTDKIYQTNYNNELETSSWSKQERDSLLRRLNIYIPSYYVGPGMNINRIPTTFPFENDYAFHAIWDVGLGNRGWLSTASTQSTYPTLGSMRSINASFNYRITDNLIFSGGPYISKNLIYGNPFDDMGLNGQMKFILHDRVRLNVFGQYSVYGKQNFVGSNASGMFNQSSYGGSFEFKISDKFGIESGIIRELDPMTGKWTNKPFITPVFYGN